jgi:hypothetical protein
VEEDIGVGREDLAPHEAVKPRVLSDEGDGPGADVVEGDGGRLPLLRHPEAPGSAGSEGVQVI